jgi:D-arabinose 1-dehydrogenase-like Zn-dependent alcohol dehydrogenase
MTRAYAAHSAGARLAPLEVARRAPGPRDVEIAVDFCGVCHSDLHQVRDEWGGATFPMVPGHEIVGHVVRKRKEVGADVEVIPMQAIDEAYERMLRGDVRYRFVIDLATL